MTSTSPGVSATLETLAEKIDALGNRLDTRIDQLDARIEPLMASRPGTPGPQRDTVISGWRTRLSPRAWRVR